MFKRSLVTAALIAVGALGFSAMPAAALSVPVHQPAASQQTASDLTVQVARRVVVRNRVAVYNRGRHGIRCSRWGANCRHYYRGYYYANPWWALPVVGTGIVIGSAVARPGIGGRHVAWCRGKYRSYNARTNTYISSSGRVRVCVSPYR